MLCVTNPVDRQMRLPERKSPARPEGRAGLALGYLRHGRRKLNPAKLLPRGDQAEAGQACLAEGGRRGLADADKVEVRAEGGRVRDAPE